jgi:hypothetical protein
MNRRVFFAGGFTLLMFMGLWAWAGLHAHNAQRTGSQINSALDEMDREMGVYDSLAAQKTSLLNRMRNATEVNKKKANAHKAMIDSLMDEANESMSASDENESPAKPNILYSAELDQERADYEAHSGQSQSIGTDHSDSIAHETELAER